MEGKEEDLIIRMVPGSRYFSFRYTENARFFGTFRGLEGILEGERKEEVMVWHFTIKSEDLLLFWERIWGGERKEEVSYHKDVSRQQDFFF